MVENDRHLCDHCHKDITETSNSEDYRLALVVQRMRSHRGLVTDMAPTVPIDRNYHFCGLPCLVQWAYKR